MTCLVLESINKISPFFISNLSNHSCGIVILPPDKSLVVLNLVVILYNLHAVEYKDIDRVIL